MRIPKLISIVVIGLCMIGQTIVAQSYSNISLLSNFGRGEGESKAVI